MKTSKLKLASASDIHLGGKRTDTRHIIKNLRAAFPDNEETAQLDLICLAGDVFDTLLNLNDNDLMEIDLWVGYMLRLCVKYDIILYVLEGTPSHDWWQSARFLTINEVAGIGAKLRYVKDISVEYEPDLDIWVGFVPDESAPTTDQTLSQFKALLEAKGQDKVDVMFMHGQFEYQLPPVVKAPKHSSVEYLALVRYIISIGHVHVYSSYERIYAQGSFDRLSHGEEDPKGHIRATLYNTPDYDYEVVFVENEGAKKFVTVYVGDMPVDDALIVIERKVRELPFDSSVRIEAAKDHPLFSDMESLIRMYPMFTWAKKPIDKEEEENELEDDETVFVPITINRDNITKLLLERLASRGLPADILAIAEAKINEVK
jgi:succinate dehydrogenase flavin-adding protein (antitoxin of CptAB toxin-antitoxin module)